MPKFVRGCGTPLVSSTGFRRRRAGDVFRNPVSGAGAFRAPDPGIRISGRAADRNPVRSNLDARLWLGAKTEALVFDRRVVRTLSFSFRSNASTRRQVPALGFGAVLGGDAARFRRPGTSMRLSRKRTSPPLRGAEPGCSDFGESARGRPGGQLRRTIQRLQFDDTQVSVLARTKIPQFQRPELQSYDPSRGMTHRLTHPTHQSVSAFGHHEL